MKVNYGVLLTPALVATTVFSCMYVIHEPLQHMVFSFLSLNRPKKAKVLVVEGWLTNRMFEEAAEEFLRGNYSYCLVSGRTYSSRSPLGVFTLFGIDSVAVKFTDAETGKGHNTYHMAVASRQWLQTHDPTVSTINVFTAGPHGRKSLTIFRRVFGRDYSVGVLSSTVDRHDTALWWGSKQGTRNILKYATGYAYALLWPFEE